MDGIPYAVRATNGKHAVSPGAIWRSVTARIMSDTAPPSAGLLPMVAAPEAARETDPVISAFEYGIGHIFLLAIHGAGQTGWRPLRRPACPGTVRTASTPEPRYVPRCTP